MSVASQSTQEPEHAPPPQDEEGQQDQLTTEDAPRGEFVITVLRDMVAPMILYYVFRAVGFNELFSLLLSAIPPLIHTLYGIIKHKKVDTIGAFILFIIALSAAVSVISGDPRAILVRGAVLTGLIALWILSTIFLARPFIFRAMETLFPGKRKILDELWREDAAFRSIWQRLTVLWGVGLLVDAVIRLGFAYTLPIDAVPALESVLQVVTNCGLQAVTQVWLIRSRTYVKIFGSDHKLFARFGKGRKKKAKAGAEADATDPSTLRLGTTPANSGSGQQD